LRSLSLKMRELEQCWQSTPAHLGQIGQNFGLPGNSTPVRLGQISKILASNSSRTFGHRKYLWKHKLIELHWASFTQNFKSLIYKNEGASATMLTMDSGMGQPSLGQDNFPQKKPIFPIFYLSGWKKSFWVGYKIPGSKPGQPLIYCSGLAHGPSLSK